MNIRVLEPAEQPPTDLLLSAAPSQAVVEEQLSKGTCYVAENQEKNVIGVIITVPRSSGTLEVVNIAVDNNEHHQGLGKKIMQYILAQATEEDYQDVCVGTGNSSVGQLAFYQKCGFRITSIDPDFFIRNYDTAIYEHGIQCRDMIILSQALK
ncbi:GNAT family N-acetyltransferase [Marinococcus sp. PL1-022]|nr:GNAT family N-acetyltransferase [Marinococcus sp. PL1-022]MDX6153102.1 GNAT family N-acetyltransferase [Marinococcus sp. PL1-022]